MDRARHWRKNSPFAQAAVVCLIVFCCSGMNGTVLALGAGGSRAELIPLVDKITATGFAVCAVAATFGGTCTNKLGPKTTLILASSGYPSFIAALWLLDHGLAGWYAWIATFWHGISAALLYPAAGYVVTAYSPEHSRGRYIASMWCSQLFGNMVGSAITLGITANTGQRASRVPTAVYATIVAIESLGVVFCFFLKSPSAIRRDDGQAIAIFRLLSWREEIMSLKTSVIKPETLLLAVAFFGAQIPFTLLGALNGFFFSARTRALATLCYSTACLLGNIAVAWACDWPGFGRRRRRSFLVGGLVMCFNIAVWSSLFWFLGTHDVDRNRKPSRIDWTDRSDFLGLLVIFIFIGMSYIMYQTYHIWLCATFSNEPSKLGRYSGYFTTMRMTGMAAAYGLDSHKTQFMVEAQTYFVILMVGGILALTSAYRYTKDTKYGEEDLVIVPKDFVSTLSTPQGSSDGIAGKDIVTVNAEAASTFEGRGRSGAAVEKRLAGSVDCNC